MSQQHAERLNVLHIMADQHQAQVTGYEGHPQVLTPNLDRLAASGVRFARAYTQNSICTPSRVSILSGQYCHNHGYYGLSGPRPVPDIPSFFSHFKANDYRTAGIGQLHTPNSPRNWLETHLDDFADSFDSVDGVREQTRWYDEIRAKGLLDKEDFHNAHGMNGEPSLIPFEMSQEGWAVREAIRFIDGCAGQPFCAQVSLERPHTPCVPAKEFWDLYPDADTLALPPTFGLDSGHRSPGFRLVHEMWKSYKFGPEPQSYERGARWLWKGYLASITHVDHAVGQLLDYLDRTRLADNTIVIYTADHGGFMTAYGILEKNAGICSELGCRVPHLWRVPGLTPKGRVCTQLVENVDTAPTIASLCGLPPMLTADGKDISKLLAGGGEPVREIAVTENRRTKALRWKQWRFVFCHPDTFPGQDEGELYDGDNDPLETRNLYHDPAYQDVVHECRRKLLEWLIGTTRYRSSFQAPYTDAGDGKMPLDLGPGNIVYG